MSVIPEAEVCRRLYPALWSAIDATESLKRKLSDLTLVSDAFMEMLELERMTRIRRNRIVSLFRRRRGIRRKRCRNLPSP